MKTFENFVQAQTKGVLHIETDDGQYDENWALTIDISNIWQSYSNKSNTIVDFNNQYASALMEQQQNISSTVGDACWNEIEPIIVDELRKAIDEETSETVYNKLYDTFDKYDVYVDCGKINNDEYGNQEVQ